MSASPMWAKIKSFFGNWWHSAAGDNQGVKRHLEASADESATGNDYQVQSKRRRLVMEMERLDVQSRSVQTSNGSQHHKANHTPYSGRKITEDVKAVGRTSAPSTPNSYDFQSRPVRAPSGEEGRDESSLNRLEELVTWRLAANDAQSLRAMPAAAAGAGAAAKIHATGASLLSKWRKEYRNASLPAHLLDKSRSPGGVASAGGRGVAAGGGVQKASSNRSIYEKLYGGARSNKRQLITSTVAKQFSNWAVHSCIRMEDKLSYKNLLSQFAPNRGTHQPILGGGSPAVVVKRLDGSVEASRIERRLKTGESSLVIDLEATDRDATAVGGQETPTKAGVATPAAASAVAVEPKTPPPKTKAPVRINSLEEALVLSPQYDLQFLRSIKSRFGAKERQRQDQLEEELLRVKVLGDNREEWENQLEERLRKQLEIVPGRPVLEERRPQPLVPVLPEITDAMERLIADAMRPQPEAQVLCDAFNLTITRRDIASLAGLNWLNDQVINFYFTLLMERSKKGGAKVYAFNTFFYPKLMNGGHAVLKRWTRRVDLFAHDFILVPVHLGLHWCVSVVSVTERAIRYYDSMGGKNTGCLEALRQYLELESLDKRKTALDTSDWTLESVEKIPQQMNGSDCGMFACKYADYLTRRAAITFTQKDMPYFRRRMVYEIITQQLLEP